MVWLILGLMLGSLYAIVYGAVNLTVPLPPMSLVTFDTPAFLLGVAILLGLELLRGEWRLDPRQERSGSRMSIDWSILHWVRDVLTCPFLDFLMPKLTLLSNGGAVWLLAAGGLLCTKNIAGRGFFCSAVWRSACWWATYA